MPRCTGDHCDSTCKCKACPMCRNQCTPKDGSDYTYTSCEGWCKSPAYHVRMLNTATPPLPTPPLTPFPSHLSRRQCPYMAVSSHKTTRTRTRRASRGARARPTTVHFVSAKGATSVPSRASRGVRRRPTAAAMRAAAASCARSGSSSAMARPAGCAVNRGARRPTARRTRASAARSARSCTRTRPS